MTEPVPEKSNPQMAFCRYCRAEFITYKTAGQLQCPRCGRPTSVLVQRRFLRLIAIAVLIVMVAVLALAYRAWR